MTQDNASNFMARVINTANNHPPSDNTEQLFIPNQLSNTYQQPDQQKQNEGNISNSQLSDKSNINDLHITNLPSISFVQLFLESFILGSLTPVFLLLSPSPL